MKAYDSLFRQYKDQPPATTFAHFYPAKNLDGTLDFDLAFVEIARKTIDGVDAWRFQQQRFQDKYRHGDVPKLRNFLNYTFVRLQTLESECPGDYFHVSANADWICFNTGLQNAYGVDLVLAFQQYKAKAGDKQGLARPDWVYKGPWAANDAHYRKIFGNRVPKIAWYSKDSHDFVFDTSYTLDKEAFDHLFERAKERAGLPNASDEVVRNYLRGAIENLVPKILRNYKVAIPVYFVEEKRMQMLLPFVSASDANEVSCFLVERDDVHRCYHLKTVFDLDQAYFSARLITRPDKDWLNP
jgi:hypothetical protein